MSFSELVSNHRPFVFLNQPIADPQGVAAEKFSLKWESTQLGETLNAKLGIVFNSARKKYLR